MATDLLHRRYLKNEESQYNTVMLHGSLTICITKIDQRWNPR